MGAVPQLASYLPVQLLCTALRTLCLWFGAPPVGSLMPEHLEASFSSAIALCG